MKREIKHLIKVHSEILLKKQQQQQQQQQTKQTNKQQKQTKRCNKRLQFYLYMKLVKEEESLLAIFHKRYSNYCSWWKYIFQLGI